MKPALYYTIHTMCMYPKVIAVTSEKARGRWYGREVRDNTATHGTNTDVRGRWDTQAEAEAMLTQVSKLAADYQERREQLANVVGMLSRSERDAMDALFKGEQPRTIPSIVHVDKRYIASSNVEWMCQGKRGGKLEGALAQAHHFIDEAAGGIVVVKGYPH
jgi:hypothetical protein